MHGINNFNISLFSIKFCIYFKKDGVDLLTTQKVIINYN